MKEFEFLEHPADLKIKSFGKTKEESFINMMRGMFTSAKREKIKKKQLKERKITINSINLKSLLVDFLSEVLYLSEVHNEAYFDGKITIIEDSNLVGKIFGQETEGFRREIKGVTHYGLEIKKVNKHWEAVVLFDI